MTAVPLFLAGMPVVAYALLNERRATGRPSEFMRGEHFVPALLAICRSPDGGFYLLEWSTVTDTWHQTLDDAQHQAEYDHGGAQRWVLSAT